ncbi:MAG: hypothetical protein ACR2ND_02775 [Solirubrobacteraceae bacterium]
MIVRSLVVLLATAGAWAGMVSSAAAHPASSRTLVLHPNFQRVQGNYLVASDRYVFISGSPFDGEGGAGVLIDGSTGHRTTISRPGCLPSALGGPWLAFTCGAGASQSFQLYNIPTGQSQPFTSTIPYQDCTIYCVAIAAVGTDWVALEPPAGDEHDVPTFEFQNLNTGATTGDPTNSMTTVDLNSPQLVEKVCRPLTVPAVSNGYSSGWGSLTYEDGYAIASGGGAYLERCGSHLHDFLTFTIPDYLSAYVGYGYGCPHLACPPASNSQAIVWESAAGRLSGIFLPSRRRFTIRVPTNVDPQGALGGFANGDLYTLALTPRTLYLMNQTGVWSIPAPAAPRTGATTCGTPYTFKVDGKAIPSGSCAATIGPKFPLLTVRVGRRFSVQILHEEDGRLDFPVPAPTTTTVRLLGRRGSTASYLARSRGTTTLVSRHTRFCANTDPHIGTCTALKVRVVGP